MAVTTIGQAFVEIVPDTQGFGKETEKELDKQLKGVGEKAGKEVSSGLGSAMKGIGAAVAAGGVASFFKSSIDAAGDLNEQVSKTEVVFGEAAGAVLEFGKNATKSIGASETEALTAASTYGNLLRSVGLTNEKAAEMSTTMVQLAGDLASFNNVPVAEALQAIQSGLSGETEPLKKFGINLNEATLKAEAMRLGLDVTGTTLSTNTKLQSAYSLMLSQSSLAQGDFARTADSLANQQRTLSAEFANAKAEIGQALLPAMLGLVSVARDLLPMLGSLGKSVGAFGDIVATIATPVLGFVGGIAGSDFGQFAITATLASVAIGKIGTAAIAAKEALLAMEFASGKMTAAAAGIGAVIGIAVSLFGQIKSDAKAAAEQQDRLSKAMLDAGDPAAVLAQHLTELNGQLDSTAKKTKDAATGVEGLADPLGIVKELGPDAIEMLNDMGVSLESVTKGVDTGNLQGVFNVIREGARAGRDAFGENVPAANEYSNAVDGLMKKLENLSENTEASRQSTIENIQAQVEAAVFAERVSQKWLDQALAQSTATTEAGKWIEVGKQLDAVLSGQADALTQAAEGSKLKAEADEQLKAADEDMAEAQKELKEAIDGVKQASDDAKKAQDDWLLQNVDYQAGVDAVTQAILDLDKTETDLAKKRAEGTLTAEEEAQANIDLNQAFGDVYSQALKSIQSYDDLGYSSEQARAKQNELAQSAYDTAIAFGRPQEEAQAIKDKILQIPTSVTSDIDVAAKGVEKANSDIDQAARDRETAIAVQFKVQNLDVINEVRRQMNLPALSAAHGAVVKATPGGTSVLVGEGGQDEAIIPLTQRMLGALAAFKRGERVGGQGGDTTVNVAISGATIGGDNDARHLGRIVGETAAQVLAQRQMATAMRMAS